MLLMPLMRMTPGFWMPEGALDPPDRALSQTDRGPSLALGMINALGMIKLRHGWPARVRPASKSRQTFDARSASRTRSGVNGTCRTRAPVASKIAFAIAAGIGDVAASPAPTDG